MLLVLLIVEEEEETEEKETGDGDISEDADVRLVSNYK